MGFNGFRPKSDSNEAYPHAEKGFGGHYEKRADGSYFYVRDCSGVFVPLSAAIMQENNNQEGENDGN